MAQTATKVLKMLGTLGAGTVVGTLAHAVNPFLAPIIHVAGDIIKHYGGEFTESVTHHFHARAWKAPQQLNHDLQRLFAESIAEAISEGIVAAARHDLENTGFTTEDARALKQLGRNIGKLFTPGDDMAIDNLDSKALMSLVDKSAKYENLVGMTNSRIHDVEFHPEEFLRFHEFDEVKVSYFQKNLLPITRIFFIEGLKSTDHSSARIAYEQMMAEETMHLLREMQNDIKEGSFAGTILPGLEKVSAQALGDAIKRLEQSGDIRKLMGTAVTESLNQLDLKMDQLIALEKDTNTHVRKIAVKATRIEKKVGKGLVMSYLLLAIAIAGGLGAYFYFRQSTFTAAISFTDDNGSPLQSGNFFISYGTKRESGSIGSNGLATLTEIPDRFEGKAVELLLDRELLREYELDSTSRLVKLQPGGTIKVMLRKRGDISDETNPTDKGSSLSAIKGDSDSGADAELAIDKSVADKSANHSETPRSSLPPSPKVNMDAWVKLDGARFARSSVSSSLDEDFLELSFSGGDRFTVTGNIGMMPISTVGKVTGSSSLRIDDASASGTLNFSESWDVLSGSLFFSSINKSSSVNQYRRIR